MNKKKILLLIENLGSGGAERQLTGLAAMLKSQGMMVQVCYYVPKDFYVPYLKQNGVDVYFLSEATSVKHRYGALKKKIKTYKPDTIISYTASTSMCFCMMKLLGAKFKLIVSERNTTQELTLMERLRFFLYRWADVVVPNSHSQESFIKAHFKHLSHKVFVITNFVDTEKFKPVWDKCEDHDEVRMICVGRMMPQKNIPTFIKAIKKVVEDGYKLHVDWFGHDLKDAYSKQCHDAISDNSLENTFLFHSESPDIADEYRKADVFCLPSLYEGFPNVLCEAMSCGLPVMAGRVCDNPTIVREGDNGFLFDPNNIDEMAATIENYIGLPKERVKRMGECGREIAVELFSKKSFIDKYCQII